MAEGVFSNKWKWEATPWTGRDATSARMFYTPATCKIAGGADLVRRWRIGRPRSKWKEMGDALRVAIRVVHATAGELSQPMAA
jgi:hypothetical protein